jgi:hypothetical protein
LQLAHGDCAIDALQASAVVVIGGGDSNGLPDYLQPTAMGTMELRKAFYSHGNSKAAEFMDTSNPKVIDAREEAVLNIYHSSS